MTLDWIVNEGNQEVLSAMTAMGLPGCYKQTYDNRPLCPYVGKPGWVIEAPEYAEESTFPSLAAIEDRPIQYWARVFSEDSVLRRLLHLDTGLYRARWSFSLKHGNDFFLYSSACVRGVSDLKYDHNRIAYHAAQEPHLWDVEELLEMVSDTQKRFYCWAPVSNPTWAEERPFRLRSVR